MVIHEQMPNFECTVCNKRFSKSMELDMHVRTYHRPKGKESKQYNCEDCSFQGELELN